MSSVGDIAAREERRPYVRFERVAVSDAAATLAAGHYVAKDVDYALITPPYSKDVFKQVVKDWFAQLDRDANAGRLPKEWIFDYRKAYKMWQEGQEMPVDGTAIKGWGVISPAQQETLIRMNIRTVEDLALVNDEGMKRIGMGALDLKNKASAWISQMKDKGATTIELAELKRQNAILEGSVESLKNQVEKLMSQLDKPEVNRSIEFVESNDITAMDILDDDLNAQYEAKFGKKPHHMMKPETIRQKLEA